MDLKNAELMDRTFWLICVWASLFRDDKYNFHALLGQTKLDSDLHLNHNDSSIVYTPERRVRRRHKELLPGLTFGDYLSQNLDLVVTHRIPVMRNKSGDEGWELCWRPFSLRAVAFRRHQARIAQQLEIFLPLANRHTLLLQKERSELRLRRRHSQFDRDACAQILVDAFPCPARFRENLYLGRAQLLNTGRMELPALFYAKVRALAASFGWTETDDVDDLTHLARHWLAAGLMLRVEDEMRASRQELNRVDDVEALVHYHIPSPLES